LNLSRWHPATLGKNRDDRTRQACTKKARSKNGSPTTNGYTLPLGLAPSGPCTVLWCARVIPQHKIQLNQASNRHTFNQGGSLRLLTSRTPRTTSTRARTFDPGNPCHRRLVLVLAVFIPNSVPDGFPSMVLQPAAESDQAWLLFARPRKRTSAQAPPLHKGDVLGVPIQSSSPVGAAVPFVVRECT